ncbi:Energy-coupling factor transporter ATP-binding protein EcfA 2 [[Clostridium] ultunense Esp]|nr:Energy-coupling factor transporter ATP-binding protein EcfA 2 [[Clostridium] ultunense Esp]
MEPMIRVEDLHFSYPLNQKQTIEVLKGISFSVYPGEYVAIIGRNGSGKSTLAKLLNGLLLPTSGDVWIKGFNTKERTHLQEIRKRVGMVFQHPDNQIVATIVEEDVAFGLENLSVPREEMKRRVDEALEAVGLTEYRFRPPHHLSGGQKQRVAIAGVLAMAPECIIFDEATSMLDRIGQQEVLEVMRRLHREKMTILTVTHHMEEAAEANRILLLHEGQILLDGSPREVFRQKEKIYPLGVDIPEVLRLAERIHGEREDFSPDLLTQNELIAEVERLRSTYKIPQ